MCVGCRKSKPRKKAVNDCNKMYNELVVLDIKAIEKYEETNDSEYLSVNKQLRIWIKNLKVECPPEQDLELIKTILNEHPVD